MNTLSHAARGDPGPEVIGAVMVIGGGIAGMQAALDLADQGFKVHLIENKSAIGGHMAQLDKTFPTNDCAMCNISPKLVDTGRHPNIDILTNTDVLRLDGQPGNFQVTLKRRPRYIDPTVCIGCGECAQVCPVSVPDAYEQDLKTRQAAFRLYAQAVPGAYAIEKAGTAPCRDGCPAGQRAQGYIALIAAGRYQDALRVIKEENPFPSVCGRTCHHPCESKCSRRLLDEPIAIMDLKRFVVDYALAYGRPKVEPAPRTRPEWVAVVGAGPAGLTAAHDLARLGYGVTVYEALPVPGGMMRVGIPAHRLPKGVLQQDIDDILALGIVLKTNSPIKDPTHLLSEGYHAVCLATGISSDDHSLGIEGEAAEGVISAARFLRQINLGQSVDIGRRVAVVGGGITALDAAAVARRLGAEIVYLVLDRPRGELPAYHWEVAAIEAEGIHLYEHTQALKIHTVDGRVNGIDLLQEKTTSITLEVDTVIGTVSQFSDLKFLDPQFDDLTGDKDTLASTIPGIFVVGGRKTGASYIINAVALGHQVAASIHHYLQVEEPVIPPRLPVVKLERETLLAQVAAGQIKSAPRQHPALLPMAERVTSFREVVLGLTERQAREEAQRCLQCGVCSECLECERVCGVAAIHHHQVAHEEQLQVGAVILAPGYQVYQAAQAQEFGFGRFPNVVTSLQFERLLSASGPTGGRILRPSDRQVPRKIAFLQCIGSRDQEHDYCSAICCMAATKEAMLAKEHHPEVDIHIFMMEMRAFSKGYQAYFERAREKYGIHFTRCRISALQENPANQSLILQYLPEDRPKSSQGNSIRGDDFDLVVLSVGMQIPEPLRDLAVSLELQLDEFGFCRTDMANPLQTTRPGVYAIGPFREPKDIPESVVEASGAAAASAACLADSRWSSTVTREFPPERDFTAEPTRIGVFVCHCGSNIGGFLDVPAVTQYAARLPHVAHAEDNLYTCSQDSIKTITERILEHDLNRVVVASCSPLTHAPLFQDSLRAAGLNPYMFEMANIRNQCSWVHSHDWDAATRKARDLVRMAVARAALLEPQHTIDIPVRSAALVVGGGMAGMSAALALANQGFPVHLVEMAPDLGGSLRRVFTTANAVQPQKLLNETIRQVTNHPRIDLHLESQVVDTAGFKGNFSSSIQHGDGTLTRIQHGAAILANGGCEYLGPEYGYGSHPHILTQMEFEKRFFRDGEPGPIPRSLAMILCVGPAEQFCSRICCTIAIKNALAFKARYPQAEITILYKDIRTYGFKEKLYTQAREAGILFLRYTAETRPVVEGVAPGTQGGSAATLRISFWEPNLDRAAILHPDLLVLSMPIVPNPDMHALARLFKVPLDADGFFQEAHVKLRPVDFATDGIFMAGLAHYPKLVDEAIIQGQAAAARAARILSQTAIKAGGSVAVVDPALCTGCLTCVRVCPFGVPVIDPALEGVGHILGAARIESAVCQGCGSCAAECPAHAIQLLHYADAQMSAKATALVRPDLFVD